MTAKSLLRSFAGGEITPELFGRLDLAKFQTGLEKSENFITLAHGPAVNRPGLGYVLRAKHNDKKHHYLPFIFSTSQAYVLEMGDQYLRIHTQGATLLNASQNVSAVTQANPGVLTYVGTDPANGTWMYVEGLGGMTQLNGRWVKVANVNAGANTFELQDLDGNNIDTTAYTAYTSGGTVSPIYEISTPYVEADLYDLHYTQSADVLTITHPTYQQRELKRLGATNWTLTTLAFAPTQAAPTSPVATATGAGAITYSYKVTAIATDGLEESLPTSAATCTNNLATAGNYNTITWTDASGAIRYNVYKALNGVYGYIGQAAAGATGLKDDNITADMSKTIPETEDPFTGSSNYPSAVGYFKGRRWFAGTDNKPQNLWGTRSGTEKNMTYSIPTQDDDRIAVRLTARQANRIRHIVPLGDLLLLTSGEEWLITSQNSDAITPTTIDYKTQGYIGAGNQQPVVTSKSVLYVQDRGARVREMLYRWESQGYDTNDISVMAPHLFEGHSIKCLTYMRAPFTVAWAVRDDGVLLGCTYMPEHQVIGWHQHNTPDGEIESACVIPEGDEDILYLAIKRTLTSGVVRQVERMHTRQFAAQEDAFFVDSGLTYDGAPATTISGLWHLEGEVVGGLADGAVFKNKTVTNGAITLDNAASVVHVGLLYTSKLKTLPLASEAMQAFGQGTKKNVNRVHMRVKDSSSIYAGPAFDKLTQYRQRTTEPYGSPPNLVSGLITLAISPSWSDDASVCLQQEDPLPVSILSMIVEVELGG